MWWLSMSVPALHRSGRCLGMGMGMGMCIRASGGAVLYELLQLPAVNG